MLRALQRTILATIVVASLGAPPAISAETTNFESSTTLLAESCGKDIEANCLGVSLDATRLKECLSRNQDVVSAQCRADYTKAFDAIQKRISARNAVWKACERDKQKICAEAQGKPGETMACLLKAPTKSLGWACNQSLTQAGYR
jgi:hypothetical protein